MPRNANEAIRAVSQRDDVAGPEEPGGPAESRAGLPLRMNLETPPVVLTQGREDTMMLALGELEDQRGELETELKATRVLLARRDAEAQGELAAVRSALGDAHDQMMSLEQHTNTMHVRSKPSSFRNRMVHSF